MTPEQQRAAGRSRHEVLYGHAERWQRIERTRYGLRLTYERRPRDAYMGRFGGGWQYALGARWSGRVLLVDLLVASVRIERAR